MSGRAAGGSSEKIRQLECDKAALVRTLELAEAAYQDLTVRCSELAAALEAFTRMTVPWHIPYGKSPELDQRDQIQLRLAEFCGGARYYARSSSAMPAERIVNGLIRVAREVIRDHPVPSWKE